MNDYKEYLHNPPHLFIADGKYFITASTYKSKHHLRQKEAKEELLSSMFKGFDKEKWIIEDWVILDNHYYIMVQANGNVKILPNIIRDIHRFTSLKIKKIIPELKYVSRVWYNYWDTCITYEKSYFARINYIWYNPVKHGYVNNPSEWKFGSYYFRYKKENYKIKDIRKKYPCDSVKIKDEF